MKTPMAAYLEKFKNLNRHSPVSINISRRALKGSGCIISKAWSVWRKKKITAAKYPQYVGLLRKKKQSWNL